MRSYAAVVSGSNLSLNSVIGTLLPRRTQHRIVLSVAMICLVSLIIGLTFTLSARSNQVLLVSNAVPVQQAMTAKGGAVPVASKVTLANAPVNASKALVRINQLDPAQYTSQQDYNTWAYSACSTAAMTAVINSYGHHYRLADILKVEAGLNEITPDLGLLEPTGIDHTVAKFGFTTDWLSNASLDTLIKVANQGHPVIVGFPPALWAGGHLLVVRGGNSQDVYLADSSRLNMQVMARATFLKYWAGFAVVVTPTSSAPVASTSAFSVIGKPTITADFINQVLTAYHSPAASKGQALYDLGVQYGIDPAFALAFFMHESSFGTSGEAIKTLSLGNLRCIPNVACVDQDRGGYAAFSSWEAGFQAWYTLMKVGYIQGGINTTIGKDACPCTSVQQIIPVYAPTSDNNDEQAYINALLHAITVWHSGQITV
jgi:hypothetical protein